MADEKITDKPSEKQSGEDQAVGSKAKKYAFHRRFAIGVTIVLLFLTSVELGTGRPIFLAMNDSWMDKLFRQRGMEAGDPRVTVVTLDDATLKKIGAFPPPRSMYEDLVGTLLDEYGVRAVGLDVLFPDPSDSQIDKKTGKVIRLGPNDKALVRITKKAGKRLVHAFDLDSRTETYLTTGKWAYRYPFSAVKEAAQALGLVDQLRISGDGSVRRMALFVGSSRDNHREWVADPQRVPVFGLKLLEVYEGKKADDYIHQVGGNTFHLNVRGETSEDYEIEFDVDGNETGSTIIPAVPGIHRIPVWRILEKDLKDPVIDRARLKDGIVLVGSTAVGYYDHYPSPFTHSSPGVEAHANMIDNLLNDRFLRKISGSVTLVLIVIFAYIAYKLVSLPALYAGLSFGAVLIAWMSATYYSFLNLHILEFTQPALALIIIFSVLMVHKTMLEQQQKREVRQMFGQYVAPEIVDILVKDPGKLKLGGEKRDMTIFFLDIAHFTTISEKMAPENLINFLNAYLTALTDDVLGSQGVVDKYIGDCIMAFWNAPLEVKNHREKACIAALGCIKTIERLNREYVDPTMPEKPAVRIGLNSGGVVVGNTGSARKLAYTVLGDDVNLASRLEGANKFFGSVVMVSEDTYGGAKNAVEARRLGQVRVVGKDIPILVYELLAKKGELSPGWAEALPIYHESIDKYLKRDFVGAKPGFEKVLELVPGDKPTRLYLSSCEDYIVIPPPDNWDGVFNLTSK